MERRIKYIPFLSLALVGLLLSSCMPSDAIDVLYVNDIYVSSNTSVHTMDGTTFGGGGVTSFNARTGVVLPLVGDYSAFYEPIIAPGLITDYWRGDKSWQSLPSVAGFIPYTGATDNINLNAKYVTNGILDSITVNGTWTASGTWKLPAVFFNGDITTDRWLSQDTNTFLGVEVIGAGNLANTGGSEGYYNTAIGYRALHDITTSYFNTAVGAYALENLTTGIYNTAVGQLALGDVTTGQFNTAVGMQALRVNTGSYNTAIGLFAGGDNILGDSNIFIGASAGKSELGSNKLYIDVIDTATPLIWGNFSTDNLTFNGTVNLATHQIKDVVDPTLAQDAATKNYVDTTISSGVNYAGMYRHESVAATAIQQIDDWHLVNGFTTGYLGGGWIFHTGEQVAITAYADNGDGRTLVTCAGGHTLINGDVISISGTTSYDGVWVVANIAGNNFVINRAWVADDGASVGEHGSNFHSAAASSAGKYLVAYTLSLQPLAANCQVEVSTYLNAIQVLPSESQTRLGVAADCQLVSGFSIIDIATNDVISLGIRNLTDDGDFTVRNGNMTLVKLS